jgi:hypothetical protein
MSSQDKGVQVYEVTATFEIDIPKITEKELDRTRARWPLLLEQFQSNWIRLVSIISKEVSSEDS